MLHHFPVHLKQRLCSVKRSLFSGDDVAAVNPEVKPHDRVSDQVKCSLGQAPVRTIGTTFNKRRNSGVQIHEARTARS